MSWTKSIWNDKHPTCFESHCYWHVKYKKLNLKLTMFSAIHLCSRKSRKYLVWILYLFDLEDSAFGMTWTQTIKFWINKILSWISCDWFCLQLTDWPFCRPQLLLIIFQNSNKQQRLYKPSRSNPIKPALRLLYYPTALVHLSHVSPLKSSYNQT